MNLLNFIEHFPDELSCKARWKEYRDKQCVTCIRCQGIAHYLKSYEEFIPKEKHLQSKSVTFTIESYNSRIRHYLDRFKRKTKCYSKSILMIEYSLKLLMLKMNNKICILH